MATIARWGPIIKFKVNKKHILTFNKFKQTGGAEWKKHEIPGLKPKMEYVGGTQTEVKLDVTLSAHYGVKPRAQIRDLSGACRRGDVYYLFLGGHKLGTGKWYLEKMSQNWEEIWNKGELVTAKLSLTFKEYV